jgi:hypothetical protein
MRKKIWLERCGGNGTSGKREQACALAFMGSYSILKVQWNTPNDHLKWVLRFKHGYFMGSNSILKVLWNIPNDYSQWMLRFCMVISLVFNSTGRKNRKEIIE